MAAILLIVGAALIAVGVAFIYWPAGLIVAGAFLIAYAAIDEYSQATPEPTVDAELVDA